MKAGKHDAMSRRRAVRYGRERGINVYIPAEVLIATGFDPYSSDEPPYYRTWAGRDGGVILRLYRER